MTMNVLQPNSKRITPHDIGNHTENSCEVTTKIGSDRKNAIIQILLKCAVVIAATTTNIGCEKKMEESRSEGRRMEYLKDQKPSGISENDKGGMQQASSVDANSHAQPASIVQISDDIRKKASLIPSHSKAPDTTAGAKPNHPKKVMPTSQTSKRQIEPMKKPTTVIDAPIIINPEKWRIVSRNEGLGNYPYDHYVDENGRDVFESSFVEAQSFREGFAVVKCCQLAKYYKYYYININGVNAFGSKEFDDANSFNGGTAMVKQDGKYFFINKKGENAFGDKYFIDAKPYKENLAAVRRLSDEKSYYINRGGANAFGEKLFDSAESFSEGFAVVYEKGKYYYIDKSGASAFGGKLFDQAYSFNRGTAIVREGNRSYTINKKGEQTR